MTLPVNSPARAISPSLSTLGEIATALAASESLGDVVPGVLDALGRLLDAAECAIWVRDGSGGLRRWWTRGATSVSAPEMERYLAGAAPLRDGTVAARLMAGRRPIGALTLRPTRGLSAEEHLLFSTAADMLAPVLGQAEYAQRLESEVAARTAEIEAQRHFLANLVDSLPVGLYVIDREFRIQAWNRKRETGMQGVSREEAIGRTIFEILHRQPAELLRAEFEDVFRTGRVQQFQVESDSSGERRTFRISKIPMRRDGGPVTHVITIGEDVTDWREAQDRIAQGEKLAAIGTLAAGVMHEINNPLATIAACAEALALTLDAAPEGGAIAPPGLRDSMKLIEGEVHRCKRIVDTLLDFSRPAPSTKSVVDVDAIVERTLFILKHHPRFKQLTVTVDAATAGQATVQGNEEQLVQVLMALLLNAMDAIEAQGTVAIRTRCDGPLVRIDVEDSGEGIRTQDLNKIFEPFYTTKRPGRGTGLGLSICYAIVAEHGGRVEVDSVLGEGTVFHITLPRTVATPAASAVTAVTAVSPEPNQ